MGRSLRVQRNLVMAGLFPQRDPSGRAIIFSRPWVFFMVRVRFDGTDKCGEVPEWTNGRDWKSRRGLRLSRVRIPPSPPFYVENRPGKVPFLTDLSRERHFLCPVMSSKIRLHPL